MSLYRSFGKRAFDVCAVLAAAPLWIPIIAISMMVVRAAMGSPVLFRQIRPGQRGSPFTILKFRTMRDFRDSNGEPLPDAQRLTRFGRFLRQTSLDELPEFINVLRGNMSLVGPRPLLMRYLGRYNTEQTRRHDVRPGITGWAQVKGRNALDWDEKLKLDVWYVDNLSLGLDIRILLMTVTEVFNKRGIAAPGHETMPEFTGSRESGSGDSRDSS